MSNSLFISDLHLSPDTPAASNALRRFLDCTARDAESLFVLGDLFEYWIGDDTLDSGIWRPLIDAFASLATHGVNLFFMHGNRDFLVGGRFEQATGMRVLADPTLIFLHGVPTLLMHGDTLCSDDLEYQKFRAMVRSPAWQEEFLSKSPDERNRIAQQARAQSERAKQTKQMLIMDVNRESVEAVLRAHDYPRLIHGHTHRPARHEHIIDGRRCERFVLADWYEQGSYLYCDASGCRPAPVR